MELTKEIQPEVEGGKTLSLNKLKTIVKGYLGFEGILDDSAILKIQERDSKIYGQTSENFAELVSMVKKELEENPIGKRVVHHQHILNIHQANMKLCGMLNHLHLNEAKDAGKGFVKELKEAVGVLSEELHQGQGFMTLIWSPTQDEGGATFNEEGCLAPYVGGWDDGKGKSRGQLGSRLAPVTETDGKKVVYTDSISIPMYAPKAATVSRTGNQKNAVDPASFKIPNMEEPGDIKEQVEEEADKDCSNS